MKESFLIREIREKVLKSLQPLLHEHQMFIKVSIEALPELDLDSMRQLIIKSTPEEIEAFIRSGHQILEALKKTEQAMKLVLPNPMEGWFEITS